MSGDPGPRPRRRRVGGKRRTILPTDRPLPTQELPSAKKLNKNQYNMVAGGLGFEPRLAESESAVLPLNYPPTPSWLSDSETPLARPELVAVHRLQDFDARTRHVDHLHRLSKARAACGCTEACRTSLPGQRLAHSWLSELPLFLLSASARAMALPSCFGLRVGAQGPRGPRCRNEVDDWLIWPLPASASLPLARVERSVKGPASATHHTCGSRISLLCGSARPPTTDVPAQRGYASR